MEKMLKGHNNWQRMSRIKPMVQVEDLIRTLPLALPFPGQTDRQYPPLNLRLDPHLEYDFQKKLNDHLRGPT